MTMKAENGDFEPGLVVRHPGRPDWGLGRVQSVIGHRLTVNFEDAGKLTLDIRHVSLEIVRGSGQGRRC
jgi:hypothetical protein